MISDTEKKVLEKVASAQLITKQELQSFLKNNGDDGSAVAVAAKKLVERNFLAEVNPVGSTCYVITQRGTRFLSDL